MSEPFEIPFIVLTGTLAFTVGISVLVIKDASTHALTELLILSAALPWKYTNRVLYKMYKSISKIQTSLQRGQPVPTERTPEPDTEEPPTIRRITSSWEALANFALLIMLSLEVFRISIPDSQIANLTLAILNIVYGFTAIFNLYLWAQQMKPRPPLKQKQKIL